MAMPLGLTLEIQGILMSKQASFLHQHRLSTATGKKEKGKANEMHLSYFCIQESIQIFNSNKTKKNKNKSNQFNKLDFALVKGNVF